MKPEFVFMMVFLKAILETLKPADKVLQSREIGYVDAVSVISSTLKRIEDLRTDGEFGILQVNNS